MTQPYASKAFVIDYTVRIPHHNKYVKMFLQFQLNGWFYKKRIDHHHGSAIIFIVCCIDKGTPGPKISRDLC